MTGRVPILASFNFLREMRASSGKGSASPSHLEMGISYASEITLMRGNSCGSQSRGQIVSRKVDWVSYGYGCPCFISNAGGLVLIDVQLRVGYSIQEDLPLSVPDLQVVRELPPTP